VAKVSPLFVAARVSHKNANKAMGKRREVTGVSKVSRENFSSSTFDPSFGNQSFPAAASNWT
jgi:hypothetical protein